MTDVQRAIDAANHVLDLVNVLTCDKEAFAKTICSAHRTLQQSTMRLFITTIQRMAQNDTDERNEQAVEMAKKIAEIANDYTLPLI